MSEATSGADSPPNPAYRSAYAGYGVEAAGRSTSLLQNTRSAFAAKPPGKLQSQSNLMGRQDRTILLVKTPSVRWTAQDLSHFMLPMRGSALKAFRSKASSNEGDSLSKRIPLALK